MSIGPKIVGIWGYPNLNGVNTEAPLPLQCDQFGVLLTRPGALSLGTPQFATFIGPQADAQLNTAGGFVTPSFMYGYDGVDWDRIRLANTFKTVSATALGATAIWAPAGGNLVRIMGYTISVAGTLAATGVQTIKILDAAATVFQHVANVIQTQTVSISGSDTQIGADLGQGYVTAIAGNTVNVSLGTAMATGAVTVNMWGIEAVAP
jgi:hypothetical protein